MWYYYIKTSNDTIFSPMVKLNIDTTLRRITETKWQAKWCEEPDTYRNFRNIKWNRIKTNKIIKSWDYNNNTYTESLEM